MDRLRCLKLDLNCSNASNASHEGYETARDESCCSSTMYFSMIDNSMADNTIVAEQAEVTADICKSHISDDQKKIPDIVVTSPLNEQKELKQTERDETLTLEETVQQSDASVSIDKFAPTESSANEASTSSSFSPRLAATNDLSTKDIWHVPSNSEMTRSHSSRTGLAVVPEESVFNLSNDEKENNATTSTKATAKRSSRISLSLQYRRKVQSSLHAVNVKTAIGSQGSITEIVPGKRPSLLIAAKTRQSLAFKNQSPAKRNTFRRTINSAQDSQASGSSQMASRTRQSASHAKLAELKTKSPLKIAGPSRPIVKSPLKPSSVAAEAAAAERFRKPSYVCGVCSKKFLLMTHLNAHKRAHKSSSSHRCQYCDRTFAIASALDTHLRENCLKIPSLHRRKLFGSVGSQPKLVNSNETTKDQTSDNSSSSDYGGSSSSSSMSNSKRSVVSSQKIPHTGIYRTPSKYIRCHACGQKYRDVVSYTEHSATHNE